MQLTGNRDTLNKFLNELDAFIVQCEDIATDLRARGKTGKAERYGLAAYDAAELYRQAETLDPIAEQF